MKENRKFISINRNIGIERSIEDIFAEDGAASSDMAAIETNIRESMDEIETLRGTMQYWESRPAATDSRERSALIEAYRIMHGELVGLTARMKALIDRTEALA